jgi:GNAT superfamily N-acetyltransferase
MGEIIIRTVKTPKEKMTFIKLPWKIYKGDEYWVPHLIMDRKKVLDTNHHPFYKHSEIELFLAEKGGEVVGRIAAIVNHNHNNEHKENIGFFGFFESINDQEVANSLFDAASKWLKAKGLTDMRGPVNPSVNEDIGLLVDGFYTSPVVMMTYNPRYYVPLLEKYGLKKAKDLYAYLVNVYSVMSDKMVRVAAALKGREGLTFRSLNMKDYDNEIKKIAEIYNKAWFHNWGAVPMTSEEFQYLANDMKQIVRPELVIIAEVKGKPVGFALSLPDVNVALKKIRNGKLFPFGFLKFIWYKRKINMIRILVLGVIREYQKRGIDGVLYYETAKRAMDLGYEFGDASWVLEDNLMMNRSAELLNAQRYKTYRIYEIGL